MAIGIIALLTGKTAEIITISVFGALTLYMISMIALLRLRKNEPQMERPFKVPMYPAFPVIALVIAVVSFAAMTIYNLKLALIYFLLIGICYAAFKIFKIKPTG
jgi:ethanolamine permease